MFACSAASCRAASPRTTFSSGTILAQPVLGQAAFAACSKDRPRRFDGLLGLAVAAPSRCAVWVLALSRDPTWSTAMPPVIIHLETAMPQPAAGLPVPKANASWPRYGTVRYGSKSTRCRYGQHWPGRTAGARSAGTVSGPHGTGTGTAAGPHGIGTVPARYRYGIGTVPARHRYGSRTTRYRRGSRLASTGLP